MPAVSWRPRYSVADYLLADPEERGATLLRLEGGAYAETPDGSPFELHPGCALRLEIPALFA
jgi:hypothetical protein